MSSDITDVPSGSWSYKGNHELVTCYSYNNLTNLNMLPFIPCPHLMICMFAHTGENFAWGKAHMSIESRVLKFEHCTFQDISIIYFARLIWSLIKLYCCAVPLCATFHFK